MFRVSSRRGIASSWARAQSVGIPQLRQMSLGRIDQLPSRSRLGQNERCRSDGFEQRRSRFSTEEGPTPKEINFKIVDLGRARKWQEILLLYQDQRERFNNVNLATAMSQLARVRGTQKADPLLNGIIEDIDKLCEENGLERLGLRELSNIVHAIAKLNLQDNPSALDIMNRLEKNATWYVGNGVPQAISNAVWACATLGVKSPNLFDELERRATWFVENGKQQEVSNALWACATLGVKSPNLFGQLEHQAAVFVVHGQAQAVANAVWACAVLGVESPNLFGELERNATSFVKTGTSQAIANAVWACAVLGVRSPNLFDELSRNATSFVENGLPQNIAIAIWACASLGDDQPRLVSELDNDMERFMKSADAQCLATACYGVTVLHVHDLQNWCKQMLTRMWSALMQMNTCELKPQVLQQINFVYATARSFNVPLAPPPAQLQQQLKNVTPDIASSSFEKDVSSHLQDMGFSHSVEVSPLEAFPGLFSIDIACHDRKIAIECDGPTHYGVVAGKDGACVENGATKLKRRLLEHLGWKLVNLDWKEAKEHESIYEKWLRRKLYEAGIELR